MGNKRNFLVKAPRLNELDRPANKRYYGAGFCEEKWLPGTPLYLEHVRKIERKFHWLFSETREN